MDNSHVDPIALAVAGDTDALTALLKTHGPPLDAGCGIRRNRTRIAPCWRRWASRRPPPARYAAASEAQGLLETAIERLPETYREIVRLYDLEGQSVQMVAETLGRSPGAVYMLRARALDRLREILGSGSKFFTDFA